MKRNFPWGTEGVAHGVIHERFDAGVGVGEFREFQELFAVVRVRLGVGADYTVPA